MFTSTSLTFEALHKATSSYETHGDDVEVWSHEDGVDEGDIFPAFFNQQSGRWERIGGGGSGGGDGGGGGGGNSYCPCSTAVDVGTVEIGGVLYAESYSFQCPVTGLTIVVTWDEDLGVWISDDYEYDCPEDEPPEEEE